jgi:hypothetical protein
MTHHGPSSTSNSNPIAPAIVKRARPGPLSNQAQLFRLFSEGRSIECRYRRERSVKYLMLIYANPAKWMHPVFMHRPEPLTQEELDGMMADFEAFMREVNESGELIEAMALAAPSTSKTVRIRDGSLAVTDGPFAEAKEQVAGYFVFECDNPERAIEIAARFPDVKFAAVEVRPIMDLSGLEM